ncbi:beta-glucosidase [Penicillium cataractarum]|uniref:xylan 1,4-beta-xylosidase n=1 Tax=Penicillium cataractarum TaxID=2100454 RepID=A0A9W9SP76_9EURO|nr:beta-glucosidase [Penicillium cataractarum]KAJ5382055.1 beta-glucosidase [Penicillium cataractarum]
MQAAPGAPIGIIHDWYPTNKSQYNDMQKLNSAKSRVNIPFMQTGECLHGVGSFKQSMFPQALGLAASFDPDLVYRVGRAIGSEARSIGIHACFAPVLDLAKDPRWGRVQEDWGEDFVLTSHMGVAFSSGLSKNSTWSDHDAVVPVMKVCPPRCNIIIEGRKITHVLLKHFAAHGSPQGGHNGAPFMGFGTRQVLQEMLVPFKAAVELGGVKGVMMAYNEFDDVPSSVNPLLYDALNDWGYDGFITADDTGLSELLYTHQVTSTVADTIAQWHNAGGMVQFYDFSLEEYINATIALVSNGTVTRHTLENLASRILGVKYDLGLFESPLIPEDVDSKALTMVNIPLTLEAAEKSIVLLENKDSILPLHPDRQGISQIALLGPFSDSFNYGDYSGQWGGYPVNNASTIRQSVAEHLATEFPTTKLVTAWGANSWSYNGQYNVPPYLLSANEIAGGLLATYFADTNFTDARVQRVETPSLDWGLYPPEGLPSNNFSVTWEGNIHIPVDTTTDGWLGVAVYANTSAKVYIDDALHVDVQATDSGNILSNIPGLSYTTTNETAPPPGSAPFTFNKNATHKVRLEYQAWSYVQKFENVNSLNAQVLLFWNLVDRTDPVKQAVELAGESDVVILAVGANWNSDGESGDRATLGLSPSQTTLADAIFTLGKPVILILQGGRPFAIPEYYEQAAAVLNTFFPGQSGGKAISNVLFGLANPGGRVPISVPNSVGTLPAFYKDYTDIPYKAIYPFGYGLSYTQFSLTDFDASTIVHNGSSVREFGAGSTVIFSVAISNTGQTAGSYVPQIYLLGRVSSIVRPVKQLVAFSRVYLEAGESRIVTLELEVSRYLSILDRDYKWTVETGDYTFALLDNGGSSANTSMNLTMTCVG